MFEKVFSQKIINEFFKEKGRLNKFLEGDKVKIDVKQIKNRREWSDGSLREDYKKFVEDNIDTIFTIQFDENHGKESVIVCFQEDPKWLWWQDDLIKEKETRH